MQNLKLRVLLIAGCIVWGSVVNVIASSVVSVGPFTFTQGTGNNMTVVIPKSSGPTINGTAIGTGDIVAAYTPAGLCVGAARFDAVTNTSLTVWGDDDQTVAIDGAVTTDTLSFRVYDSSAALTGRATVTWIPVGTSGMTRIYTFGTNALSGLASFAAVVAPIAPALVAPANATSGVSTTPTLTWGTVAAATTYRVQVSTSSAFGTMVVDDATLTAGSKAITTTLANNTTYYWRANATNTAGTGSWSTVFSFTTILAAPALTIPANAATGIALAPALTWTTVSGAATYRVQVSTLSTFTTLVVDDSTLTTTTKAVTGLANSTMYFWRVNAKNTAGTAAWSSIFNFTTIVTAPAAPTLGTPANTATGVGTLPTLSWGTVAGAATYRIQVSTGSAFPSTVLDDSTVTTGSRILTTALAANTVYYWRVNAKNAGGTSAFSSIFSFTTAIAVPVLISPATASTGISVNPTLTWGTVVGATTYRVQVSAISTFATTFTDDSTLSAGTKALTGLVNSTIYYWRVNAKGSGGTSSWSPIWNFTTIIAVPLTPVLTAPVNASTGISITPSLSWGTVAGAATYRVQVSAISTFATIIADDSTLTVGTKALTGLVNNAMYFWRANAKNSSGTSAWSAPWNFTTIVAAPVSPVLIAPVNTSTGISLTPTLTWGTVAGASTYRVQVSTISTFATTIVNDSTLTTGSRALTGLINNITYYWRVSAKGIGGTSAWSTLWSFKTVTTGVINVQSHYSPVTLGHNGVF